MDKIERESEIMFLKKSIPVQMSDILFCLFLKGIGGTFCNIYIDKHMYTFNDHFVINSHYIDYGHDGNVYV